MANIRVVMSASSERAACATENHRQPRRQETLATSDSDGNGGNRNSSITNRREMLLDNQASLSMAYAVVDLSSIERYNISRQQPA